MKHANQTLKSFLFTTWEGGGNVAPAITVARKLLQRGHRVRLMCDAASAGDAQAAGIAFRPWREAPNRPDRSPASCPVRDWEAANPQEGIMRLMDRIMAGPALEYARDLIAELDREPADLVVTSEMLFGIMAACESRGQQVAIFTANLCFYPLPGMPAFGPGLPPPKSPAELALHEQIKAGTMQMLDAGINGINRARLALGLLPIQNTMQQIRAVKLHVLGTSRHFDFPVEKLPEEIRYVGPQLDEPSWVNPWTPPWPASDERPLLAVGFSTTYQGHAGVIQSVIDAAAGMPVRVLVTLGQVSPDEVRPAANTVLVRSAPHDELMRQAAVVITHGGHGTVMRSLIHGRPMLIIPHGRDQDENAVRVTERGAGLRLTAAAGVDEIRSALRRLADDPSFTLAARNLGGEISREMGADPVAHLLENFAGEPQKFCSPCF